MVLHRPRAQSATPSLARKRSLGMLREMSPAVSSPFQNRLTRFSSPRIDSLPLLLPFKEPDFLPPRDIDFRQKLPPSNVLEELPLHDRYPLSPWHLRIVARGSDEPRRLTTIGEVETSDREILERARLMLRRLLHLYLPSRPSFWNRVRLSTISSMLSMYRISTLRMRREIR
jgi:hypothetical protein